MKIIDGRKISADTLQVLKTKVALMSFSPVFCDVLVGDDVVSFKYVQMKKKMAEEIGVTFKDANFPSNTSTEELIKAIHVLNKTENMCGIIVQLPLPEHIDREAVLSAIDPRLDVDCLGAVASENFYNNESLESISLVPPTALSCVKILDSLGVDLKTKNIVILGQGALVGKPVLKLLQLRGLYPAVLVNDSKNKEEILKNADVIISGIGKGGYINRDMIKEGVVLVDAGTSESNGSIVGDVDFDSVKNMDGFISPTPGGVGPVTVAMLLQNVVQVAKKLHNS
jgi:methylenetetrahydrofolate dehydrogenase (NADP+)/methenyltetrahydrofolate cyclohydrolase